MGQLKSETDNGGTPTTYGYDATGQLTGDGTNSYVYDDNGNRDAYTVNAANEVTYDGTFDYTYDPDGNETSKVNHTTSETWNYGYDPLDRLTSVQHKATSGAAVDLEVDFKYDAFGNRTEKIVDADGAGAGSAVTSKFAYDMWKASSAYLVGNENNDVLFDLNGDNTLKTRYLRTDAIDQVFARIDYSGGTSTAFWYLEDSQNSIRGITNASGTLVGTVQYDAFGNILSDSSYRGRYGWTGREYDVEVGLQYNRARYYDSSTGRWMSQDPMGFDAGDSNLYRYANNRSVVADDPSGLQSPTIGFETWLNKRADQLDAYGSEFAKALVADFAAGAAQIDPNQLDDPNYRAGVERNLSNIVNSASQKAAFSTYKIFAGYSSAISPTIQSGVISKPTEHIESIINTYVADIQRQNGKFAIKEFKSKDSQKIGLPPHLFETSGLGPEGKLRVGAGGGITEGNQVFTTFKLAGKNKLRLLPEDIAAWRSLWLNSELSVETKVTARSILSNSAGVDVFITAPSEKGPNINFHAKFDVSSTNGPSGGIFFVLDY